MMRDYLFRVHGDCIRSGYAYPLLASLKLHVLDLAQDARVYFGPFEGVRTFGGGYLSIRKRTIWRCRAPSELQTRMSSLCGRKLLIASHVIQLGELHVEEVAPEPIIHAELIVIKSQHFEHERHPEHSEFLGWCTDKLREHYGLSKALVQIGRRRKIHIGEYPAATGYAVAIHDLSPYESMAIQTGGLGGRRHMGASLFLPGALPEHVRGDRRLYDVSPRGWKRRKPQVPRDDQYARRAALWATAVAEGKYPCHRWLARQEGISHTKAASLIRSFRHDLGMAFEYDHDHRGYRSCHGTQS